MRRLAFLVAFVCVPLVLAELALRVGFADRFRLPRDERALAYRFDRELGWFPEPGTERTMQGTRRFHVRHNMHGFRDPEPGALRRRPLVVLGDSFVWGFDVEEDERFTERLRESLRDRDVLNLGVSGYGTDQQLLLLRRWIARLDPEIVLLVFAEENDRKDNSTNRRYGPYPKPFFTEVAGALELAGTPVPEPLPYRARAQPLLFSSLVARAVFQAWFDRAHPVRVVPDPSERLVLAVRDEARAHGARFALGVQGRGDRMIAFARSHEIPVAGLANRHRYPHFGGHWTPEGHVLVARRLLGLLARTGWIPELEGPR